MKRHTFSDYVFMSALFIALVVTVFLALAPKVECRLSLGTCLA